MSEHFNCSTDSYEGVFSPLIVPEERARKIIIRYLISILFLSGRGGRRKLQVWFEGREGELTTYCFVKYVDPRVLLSGKRSVLLP